MKQALLTLTILGFLLVACDSTKVYEEFSDFEDAFWHQDSVITFQFEIENANQPYNLIAHFRNSQSYPFYNMYYNYTLRNDGGEVLSEKQMEIELFDAKTGEPKGSGIGDLFDNSQLVLDNYTFPESGSYSVDLQQYMRRDTLPYVLSVGWRVETIE